MTHVDIFKDMVVTSMEDNTYGSFKLKSYLDWGMSRMNYMEVRCLDDGKLNAHDVVSAMCQVRQDAAKYICRMIIGVHCGNLWITPRSAVELEKILPDQEDVIKKYKVKDKYKTRLNEIAKEIKKKYPQDFIDGGAAVAEDRSTGEVEEPPPRISYSVEDESSSSSSSSYENNNAGEVVDEEKNNAEGVFSHNDTETDNEESSSFVLENPPLVNNASIEDGASSSNVQIDLPEIEKIDKRMFFVNGMPPTRDEMMEKIIESYCNKKYTVFDIGNKVFVYDVVGFVALGYSMENEAQAIDKYDNLQKLHSEIFDGKILIVRKKADPRLSQNDNGCLVDCVKKEHVLSILSDLPKSYVGAAVKFAMDFEKQGTSSSGGVVVQPDNSSQIQLKSAPFDAAALIPRPDIIESFNALIEDGASSSSSVPIHPPAIDLIVDKRIFFVDGRPPTRDEMMDRIRRSYSKKYLEFDIDTGFFEYNVVGVVKLGYSLEKEDQARDVYDNQDQARVKYDNLRKLHPEIFDGKKIYTKQQFGLDSIDCVDLGSALDILLELPESGYGAAAKAAMEARLDFEKEGKSSSSGIISGDPGDAMPKLPLAIDAPMEDRSDFQTGASIITSSSDQPINTNDVVENQPDQQREAEVVEQIRKDVVVEAPQNQQQQGDGGIGGSVPVQMVEDPSTSQIQMNLETSATKRKKYDMSMFLVNGKPPTTGDILKITAEKNPGKLISLKSENGRDVYKVADLVAVSYKLVTKKEVKDKYDGLQKFHREIFVGKIIPTKRAGRSQVETDCFRLYHTVQRRHLLFSANCFCFSRSRDFPKRRFRRFDIHETFFSRSRDFPKRRFRRFDIHETFFSRSRDFPKRRFRRFDIHGTMLELSIFYNDNTSLQVVASLLPASPQSLLSPSCRTCLILS
jgi:hypothetical protein